MHQVEKSDLGTYSMCVLCLLYSVKNLDFVKDFCEPGWLTTKQHQHTKSSREESLMEQDRKIRPSLNSHAHVMDLEKKTVINICI